MEERSLATLRKLPKKPQRKDSSEVYESPGSVNLLSHDEAMTEWIALARTPRTLARRLEAIFAKASAGSVVRRSQQASASLMSSRHGMSSSRASSMIRRSEFARSLPAGVNESRGWGGRWESTRQLYTLFSSTTYAPCYMPLCSTQCSKFGSPFVQDCVLSTPGRLYRTEAPRVPAQLRAVD